MPPLISLLASIPSPSSNTVPIIGIRWYGLMIALGVIAALNLVRKRWEARGHDPEEMSTVAMWAVPAGLIGTRIYHVATDWNSLYSDGRWWPKAFQIWNGGLGIPGGIFLGTVVGLIVARRMAINIPDGLDAMAPALPLAQAIGRVGNWFNQELYGGPTNKPWGLKIDGAHRPPEYINQPTFHPTFLYESLWNIGVVIAIVLIDRRKVLRRGKLFPLYILGYFTGRLWVESIRIDTATLIFGYRVNTLLAVTMIGSSLVWLFWGGIRPKPEIERRPMESDIAEADLGRS